VKNLLLATAVLALMVPAVLGFADQEHPDLGAIFNGNYQQIIDPFGTVSRAAFDGSGRLIGVQIGTYDRSKPNGMTIEMTYLEPDAKHPRGQAFDGAGNPAP
jgi:YD repeat-containing protein